MPFTREEYERERRNFRWDIPENYNIAAVVDAHAREKGDKPCILWESETGERRTLTWRELSRLSSRFAAVLMRLGVKKGDPVMHIFPRLPEAFIAQIGTFKAGGVAVPCVDMLRAKDIIYRAEVSRRAGGGGPCFRGGRGGRHPRPVSPGALHPHRREKAGLALL
jgi:Acyl-coenzyme A synthetases/AMP-(fatty) acid ligases